MRKIFLLFLLCSLPLLAQQKTAYQKKVEEIQNKYLQKYGVPLFRINQLRKDKELGNAAVEALLYEKIQNYGKTHGNVDAGLILIELSKEMNAAEKLKTPAELKKEKESIKKRLSEQEKEKQQREITEKKKREKDIEKTSDIVRTKIRIKDSFVKWAQKGEFETTNEYNKRLLEESRNQLQKISFNEIDYIFDNELKFDIKLGMYDADNEIYPIIIEKKIGFYGYKTEEELYQKLLYKDYTGVYSFNNPKISIVTEAKIEREKAIKLKEICERYSQEIGISDIYDKIRFSSDIKEWILKDGYFFPITIKLGSYQPLRDIDIINLNKKDYSLISEIEFNTLDLGLSEYFPENYTFKVNNNHIENIEED